MVEGKRDMHIHWKEYPELNVGGGLCQAARSLPTCVTVNRFRLACGPHLACCLFQCIMSGQQRPSSFFYVSSLVFSQDKGRVEDLEQGLSGL